MLEMDLTDIYSTFLLKAEHILLSFNKFKETESISSIFSNHNNKKQEINYKKKTGKFTSMWKLNTTLLNNQWIKDKIKVQ